MHCHQHQSSPQEQCKFDHPGHRVCGSGRTRSTTTIVVASAVSGPTFAVTTTTTTMDASHSHRCFSSEHNDTDADTDAEADVAHEEEDSEGSINEAARALPSNARAVRELDSIDITSSNSLCRRYLLANLAKAGRGTRNFSLASQQIL